MPHSDTLIAVFAVLALFVTTDLISSRVGAGIIRRWAAKRGMTILSIRNRRFFSGPYFARGAGVFYISFRRPDGLKHEGYAMARAGVPGLSVERVDVHWVYNDLRDVVI